MFVFIFFSRVMFNINIDLFLWLRYDAVFLSDCLSVNLLMKESSPLLKNLLSSSRIFSPLKDLYYLL